MNLKHTIIFCISFITLGLTKIKAQNLDTEKHQWVIANEQDYYIRASAFQRKSKLNPNEKMTYFWYAQNKVRQTQGGYDGYLLDGIYTAFYLSDNLKERGEMKKGLKTGKWIYWYDNGKIKEISHWKNGKKKNRVSLFDKNGNKIKRTKEPKEPKPVKESKSKKGFLGFFKGKDKTTSTDKVTEAKVESDKKAESKKGFLGLFKKKDKSVSASNAIVAPNAAIKTQKKEHFWSNWFKGKDKSVTKK